MNNDIEYGKPGLITEGAYEGWYILVEHDATKTGGYYIYIVNRPHSQWKIGSPETGLIGYDEWFETKEGVTDYFKRSGWKIKWD